MRTNMTPSGAFKRYQDILSRLPDATFPVRAVQLNDFSELKTRFDAFVFDAYGVLNIGKNPIVGAAEFIADLRHEAKQVRVLTNSASLIREKSILRFEKLGFDFTDNEIITSRDVIAAAFSEYDPAMKWGVISGHQAEIDALPCHARYLDQTSLDACDGFVFLNSSNWNDTYQSELVDALISRPRPVLVGNPDLVALHEYGFSFQPGYFAHDIWDRTDIQPRFFGKPYSNAFEYVRSRIDLRIPNERVLMIGDTLHTDILGGAAAGFATALLLGHGVLQGLDADACIQESRIVPDFVLTSDYPKP